MKYILLILIVSITSLWSQEIELSNDRIEISAERNNGMFCISDINRNVDLIGSGSVYFIVKKNDQFSSNKEGLATQIGLLDTTEVWDNRYIASTWSWGEIRIWQKLYILQDDSLRNFVGIELTVINRSTDSLDIGIAYYIDPTLGTGDANTIFTPYGNINSTRTFTYPQIPTWWIGLKDSLYQPDSIPKYMGVFYGPERNYPEKMILANRNQFIDQVWEPHLSPDTIIDYATYIQWKDLSLPPYDFYSVSFYYGLGYPNMEIEDGKVINLPKKPFISKCYPNPFNSIISIELDDYISRGDYTLSIFNLLGEKIYTFDRNSGIKQRIFKWDLSYSNLPSGVYLVNLQGNNFSHSKNILYVK